MERTRTGRARVTREYRCGGPGHRPGRSAPTSSNPPLETTMSHERASSFTDGVVVDHVAEFAFYPKDEIRRLYAADRLAPIFAERRGGLRRRSARDSLSCSPRRLACAE